MNIKWEPPKDDGGHRIKYYAVEMKDVTMNGDWLVYDQEVGSKWVGLANENQCKIEHGIRHGHIYQFRVCPVNDVGRGPWESSDVEKAEDRFS